MRMTYRCLICLLLSTQAAWVSVQFLNGTSAQNKTKYFHHLKFRGYNKNSVLYPGRFRWWKYFCCFICVTLLWALHIVIKQFLFTFINRKRRQFISRYYSVHLRIDEIFQLSRSEKKSCSLSLDAFLARFRWLSLSITGLARTQCDLPLPAPARIQCFHVQLLYLWKYSPLEINPVIRSTSYCQWAITVRSMG